MKYHEQEDNPKPIVKSRVIMAALVSIAVTLAVVGVVLWLMGKL